MPLSGLLVDRDAIVALVAERLGTRTGSLFRVRGLEPTALAVARLLDGLHAAVDAAAIRSIRVVLQEALALLGGDPPSSRDLRLLVDGLRSEVNQRIDAADLPSRDTRIVDEWFHELGHQVTVLLIAQREALIERQASQIELKFAEQRQLSIPVVPLHDGILAIPLVGPLDAFRAQLLTTRALSAIADARASQLLLDVSGVPPIDADVVAHLLRTAGAARLLGCQVILVGISPDDARTIVGLGIDLRGLVVLGTLAEGLAHGLALQGLALAPLTARTSAATPRRTG
jgi:rsbT co-antagonist protein RsbR